MRALVLNCTLKPSPAESNTEALANVVIEALEGHGVTTELVRVADYDVRPGVSSDEGLGDEWPRLREKVLAAEIAEILVMASPTWLGQPSSVAKRVLERMDAMLSETDDQERPVASYTETDHKHDWSAATGRAAAGYPGRLAGNGPEQLRGGGRAVPRRPDRPPLGGPR